ncbi:Uncharacterised protein [Candidatus Burarchaeum australiense]|nr:Uncharacterised protein [Candidatus Burarchaeum australiense]
MAKESIAKQVSALLDTDYYTKRALLMGIANASAVAQMLRREHMPRASFVAIKAAVNRYVEAQEDYEASPDLRNVLSKTKTSITSGVSVIHISPRFRHLLKLGPIYEEASEFAVINSENAITVMVDDELADDVLKLIGKANVMSIERDNSVVLLKSPSKIETTPGFVAFVSDLLARYGINMREYYSCYTDTIFVLSKRDAVRAYEIFESLS